jgi:flavin reductase (DIM6/NTAB) family NADH-FMN oxidoreductase RutF
VAKAGPNGTVLIQSGSYDYLDDQRISTASSVNFTGLAPDGVLFNIRKPVYIVRIVLLINSMLNIEWFSFPIY